LDEVRYAPATLLSRLIAVGVDLLLGTCAMLIAFMLWSQRGWAQISALRFAESVPLEVQQATLVALGVGAMFPFLFATQVTRNGATSGKALMSLTVRSADTGGFPRYGQALLRETLRFACVGPLLLLGQFHLLVAAAFAVILIDMTRNRLSQTWYDRVCRTVVVARVAAADEAGG
jgi:hypothetical protein